MKMSQRKEELCTSIQWIGNGKIQYKGELDAKTVAT